MAYAYTFGGLKMADKTNANIGFEKQLWDTCYKLLQFIAKWYSISGKPQNINIILFVTRYI